MEHNSFQPALQQPETGTIPRPRILVNVAMTADGKLDSVHRKGASISSTLDAARVDQMRAEVDAVLVGGYTLLEGDPRLTVKSASLRAERVQRGLPENPAKVGIVSAANLSPGCRFLTFGPARRLIYTTPHTAPEQLDVLRAAGAEVFLLGEDRVDLPAAFASLFSLGVRSVMVEGGGTMIASLFQHSLVDELSIYLAPRIFGGASSPTLADGTGFVPDQAPRLELDSVQPFDPEGGILIHYRVP